MCFTTTTSYANCFAIDRVHLICYEHIKHTATQADNKPCAEFRELHELSSSLRCTCASHASICYRRRGAETYLFQKGPEVPEHWEIGEAREKWKRLEKGMEKVVKEQKELKRIKMEPVDDEERYPNAEFCAPPDLKYESTDTYSDDDDGEDIKKEEDEEEEPVRLIDYENPIDLTAEMEYMEKAIAKISVDGGEGKGMMKLEI